MCLASPGTLSAACCPMNSHYSAEVPISATLKGVHCSRIALQQCNSEHSLKSEMARADTITAPSNIDKVGLLIRIGVED